ncbi:glycosyltransferase involved in cell wall biosynthesis [Inhella inkyongensis]|uniref:Glycosyltransferase involved in cell wall biosynthesis n=1 Tax=Inhella inkyongensis TaxID=392593 RepID=A0A840SBJ4_9BURK|nr:glycosyltransferase family 2 protein [Inhella inkyongensis]MBB5206376.1 glycosyltransferase involved in cell wall biosynthesis [Inhella inkyongensis]
MPFPTVSILIPTHNRPDYLPLALQSALAQSFGDFEIVISDNGHSDESLDLLRPTVAADPRIRHLRCPSRNHYLDNWLHALSHARGDYIAFLMDDDLFHPEKLARMVPLLQSHPEVALVTSYRQLINGRGQFLPDLPETKPLFGDDAVVSGHSLGERMLLSGANVVGEPTTAMFRRRDLSASFGFFAGRQYQVLSDVATWLRLIQGRRVVVLREALSYFRLHGGQDQRRSLQAVQANVEWLDLLIDSHDQGLYVQDVEAFRRTLKAQLDALVPFLTKEAEAIRSGACHIEPIQSALRRGFDRLFH